MKDIVNIEKFQELRELYDKLEYLKTTINGLDDVISTPFFVNKIYSDDHELCTIRGIDYEIVIKAFEAAKEVFVDAYEKTIDKVNNLLQ